MPTSLSPGHNYNDFVTALDANLSHIRSITHKYQLELRDKRQTRNYLQQNNKHQHGDLILWNPREHAHSMRSNKLASKLLGPYNIILHVQNAISCTHVQHHTHHRFHSDRVTPFLGSPENARRVALIDCEEFVVQAFIALFSVLILIYKPF